MGTLENINNELSHELNKYKKLYFERLELSLEKDKQILVFTWYNRIL